MSVKYLILISITGFLLAQKNVVSKIDIISDLESGSVSIVEQDYDYDIFFNKTLFSVAYISIASKKKNYVSSNALISLFYLIDTKITKALVTPFAYSTYSFEKTFFSQNEIRINAKVGQETNYYLFYSKSSVTTESYIGLKGSYKRISIAAFINKPWVNIYLKDTSAFYSLNLSVRFD